MKNSIKLIFVIFIILSFSSANAQKYKKMMDDPNVNFYDVVKEAENYFANNDTGPGSGWKGFQRWKYENEGRFSPSGIRNNIDYRSISRSYQKLYQNHHKTQNSLNGIFPNGWNDLGPYRVDSITGSYNAGLGRVETFWVDPNNEKRIYLGSRSGGFWKTTDEGNTWSNGTTDFLPATGVNTLSVNPHDFNHIIINLKNAGNSTTHGIYESYDAGDTWNETRFNPSVLSWGGLGTSDRINKVAFHPIIKDLIYVLTNKGLFITEDNFKTWTQYMSNDPVYDINFHPTKPEKIYLINNKDRNYILISEDYGKNFELSGFIEGNAFQLGNISVSSDCSDCVYYGMRSGLWKSVDEGESFEFINSDFGIRNNSWFKYAVNDADTSKIIFGSMDLGASVDGGNSFSLSASWYKPGKLFWSGNYVHADLRVAGSVNNNFYVGTDGLLCKSSDYGNTWNILNQGTGIRENYSLGISQSNHYRSISGSQDNGTSIKHKSTWIEYFGADGMEAVVHPLNDDYMIGSWQNGGRIRTTDGGTTLRASKPSSLSGSWIAPLIIDPNNQMDVYSFSSRIAKSFDFGMTWDTLNYAQRPLGGTISEAAIAYNNSDLIAISRGTNISLSKDGGKTFLQIKNNLQASSITDIAFDPNDDNTIIVTSNRFQNDGKKVFISKDLGNTWNDISFNLTNMPIRSVIIDHTAASNIYLGAEIGIYTMKMDGDNWKLHNKNLPNMSVNDMEIQFATNTIRVATWGRGLWEYSLVGREDYPAILYSTLTNNPTLTEPKESYGQKIRSIISYDGDMKSVYAKWSINNQSYNNFLRLENISDSTWESDEAFSELVEGTIVYFKIYAKSSKGELTESYKYMFEIKPDTFVYCVGVGADNTPDNYITKVNLNGNEVVSNKNTYTDYTDVKFPLKRGENYDLSVDMFSHLENDSIFAWVDYNKNSVLENDELIEFSKIDDNNNAIGNFTIPEDAKQGNLRLRIRAMFFTSNSIASPCGSFIGEVEDYTIVLGKKPNSTNLIEKIKYLYPNPAMDKLNMDNSLIGKQFQIFDFVGKIMIEGKYTGNSINISKFNTGVYFVKIDNGLTLQFIKK